MATRQRDVPPETEESEEVSHKPNVVKYNGGGVRTITEADWKTIDVDNGTVEWNRENNYTVMVSDLSDKARHHLIYVDGAFSLEYLEF